MVMRRAGSYQKNCAIYRDSPALSGRSRSKTIIEPVASNTPGYLKRQRPKKDYAPLRSAEEMPVCNLRSIMPAAKVINVDPGIKARGRGWPITPKFFDLLNRRFGTQVTLFPGFIEEANLKDNDFDRGVSVSVLEHIPEPDILSILKHVRRILKPGGLFILTVDLFLDLAPFSEKETNQWGKNISLRWLIEESGMDLIHGDPSELCGCPEFIPLKIVGLQEELLVGSSQAAVQTLILLKK